MPQPSGLRVAGQLDPRPIPIAGRAPHGAGAVAAMRAAGFIQATHHCRLSAASEKSAERRIDVDYRRSFRRETGRMCVPLSATSLEPVTAGWKSSMALWNRTRCIAGDRNGATVSIRREPRRTGASYRKSPKSRANAAGAMPLRFDLSNEACPASNMLPATIANAGRYLTTIAGRFEAQFGSNWLISCPNSPRSERAALMVKLLL